MRQLIETLRDGAASTESGNQAIRTSAAEHGADLLRQGFTIAQVVHGYGSVCQAVTDMAVQKKASITTAEFRTLNQCLDAAIAGAVSEYRRGRDHDVSERSTERLGVLSHELRNHLSSAMLAFEILQKGQVGTSGSTGAVLERSLSGLLNVVDRALSEVRLEAGTQRRALARVAAVVEEVEASAMIEAKSRGLTLTVLPGDYELLVEVDRHLFASALSNLLQNAIKFTPLGGRVCMAVRPAKGRVLIEVSDECGGLPGGKTEDLFLPYAQKSSDRSGLGLGLSIARQSVQANDGTLSVRDLPGHGCVFTVDLPAAAPRTP